MNISYLHILRRAIPWIVAGFFLLAVLLAHHKLSAYHIAHIRDIIWSVSPKAVAQALLLTVVGYTLVMFYDRLALRFIGRRVSLPRTLFAGFLGFAVSHNTGHAWLAGASLRYRFYFHWGLSGVDVIKIVIINTFTYGLGLFSVLLAAYAASLASSGQGLPMPGLPFIMAAFGCGYVAYWLAVLVWHPVVTIKSIPFKLPSGKFTLMQILAGSADVIAAGSTLYVLLFPSHSISLPEFFVAYVLALVLGTASQVPGGLGVFEAAFFQLLSHGPHDSDILASLILYRIIYYVMPLALAGLLYLAYELRHARRQYRTAKKIS